MGRTKFPRDTATRVLGRVLGSREQLDAAINAEAHGLDLAQRAWLVEVTAGALRWKGVLEFHLDSLSEKKKPSGWLRRALLTAAYQLRVQSRVTPAAVISETVELIKTVEGKAPAGFANAVLRKISTLRSGEISDEELDQSLPEWLRVRLRKAYGDLWMREFARASLERPDLWIRTYDQTAEVRGAHRGPFSGSWKLDEYSQLSEVEGMSEGKVLVQNLSSQTLVREVSARVREERGSELEVLDLCAAPGGKSVGLSWEGWRVSATDESAERLEWLKKNTRSMASDVKCIPYAERFEKDWDWIWVDAPCTGSGTLRRHPEIRWIRGESDLQSLIRVQIELVQGAWERLRPGGFLTYSVCSVLKEECDGVLTSSLLKGARRLGEWSMSPHVSPFGDGFLGVLLRRD